MARERIVIDRRAMKQILTSPEVAAELQRRAENVRSAYTPPADAPAARVVVDESREPASWGRARARVEVEYPAAIIRETRSGRLSRALDAGR